MSIPPETRRSLLAPLLSPLATFALLALVSSSTAIGTRSARAQRSKLPYEFRSANGKLVLHFANVRRTTLDPRHELYVMTGGFSAESVTQGLSLEGTNGQATMATSGGESLIERATATGAVKVTKTVHTPDGVRQTIIRSRRADYVAGALASTVKLAGPVHILDLDAGKNRTLTADGQSGTAMLAPGVKAPRSPLLAADLQGDVSVNVNQAGKGTRTVKATGSSLHYDAAGSTPSLTLRGSVVLDLQSAKVTGGTSKLSQVVLHLDSNGNLIDWTAGGGQ